MRWKDWKNKETLVWKNKTLGQIKTEKSEEVKSSLVWTWNSFSLFFTTQEHGEKCSGPRSEADKRKYFFTQHIITLWNLLPQDVMEAKSINEWEKNQKGLHKFMQLPA